MKKKYLNKNRRVKLSPLFLIFFFVHSNLFAQFNINKNKNNEVIPISLVLNMGNDQWYEGVLGKTDERKCYCFRERVPLSSAFYNNYVPDNRREPISVRLHLVYDASGSMDTKSLDMNDFESIQKLPSGSPLKFGTNEVATQIMKVILKKFVELSKNDSTKKYFKGFEYKIYPSGNIDSGLFQNNIDLFIESNETISDNIDRFMLPLTFTGDPDQKKSVAFNEAFTTNVHVSPNVKERLADLDKQRKSSSNERSFSGNEIDKEVAKLYKQMVNVVRKGGGSLEDPREIIVAVKEYLSSKKKLSQDKGNLIKQLDQIGKMLHEKRDVILENGLNASFEAIIKDRNFQQQINVIDEEIARLNKKNEDPLYSIDSEELTRDLVVNKLNEFYEENSLPIEEIQTDLPLLKSGESIYKGFLTHGFRYINQRDKGGPLGWINMYRDSFDLLDESLKSVDGNKEADLSKAMTILPKPKYQSAYLWLGYEYRKEVLGVDKEGKLKKKMENIDTFIKIKRLDVTDKNIINNARKLIEEFYKPSGVDFSPDSWKDRGVKEIAANYDEVVELLLRAQKLLKSQSTLTPTFNSLKNKRSRKSNDIEEDPQSLIEQANNIIDRNGLIGFDQIINKMKKYSINKDSRDLTFSKFVLGDKISEIKDYAELLGRLDNIPMLSNLITQVERAQGIMLEIPGPETIEGLTGSKLYYLKEDEFPLLASRSSGAFILDLKNSSYSGPHGEIVYRWMNHLKSDDLFENQEVVVYTPSTSSNAKINQFVNLSNNSLTIKKDNYVLAVVKEFRAPSVRLFNERNPAVELHPHPQKGIKGSGSYDNVETPWRAINLVNQSLKGSVGRNTKDDDKFVNVYMVIGDENLKKGWRKAVKRFSKSSGKNNKDILINLGLNQRTHPKRMKQNNDILKKVFKNRGMNINIPKVLKNSSATNKSAEKIISTFFEEKVFANIFGFTVKKEYKDFKASIMNFPKNQSELLRGNQKYNGPILSEDSRIFEIDESTIQMFYVSPNGSGGRYSDAGVREFIKNKKHMPKFKSTVAVASIDENGNIKEGSQKEINNTWVIDISKKDIYNDYAQLSGENFENSYFMLEFCLKLKANPYIATADLSKYKKVINALIQAGCEKGTDCGLVKSLIDNYLHEKYKKQSRDHVSIFQNKEVNLFGSSILTSELKELKSEILSVASRFSDPEQKDAFLGGGKYGNRCCDVLKLERADDVLPNIQYEVDGPNSRHYSFHKDVVGASHIGIPTFKTKYPAAQMLGCVTCDTSLVEKYEKKLKKATVKTGRVSCSDYYKYVQQGNVLPLCKEANQHADFLMSGGASYKMVRWTQHQYSVGKFRSLNKFNLRCFPAKNMIGVFDCCPGLSQVGDAYFKKQMNSWKSSLEDDNNFLSSLFSYDSVSAYDETGNKITIDGKELLMTPQEFNTKLTGKPWETLCKDLMVVLSAKDNRKFPEMDNYCQFKEDNFIYSIDQRKFSKDNKVKGIKDANKVIQY